MLSGVTLLGKKKVGNNHVKLLYNILNNMAMRKKCTVFKLLYLLSLLNGFKIEAAALK